MTIKASLIITGIILIGLYVFKILTDSKFLYDDLKDCEKTRRIVVVYALAIPLSFVFGVVASYRNCIIKYLNSDVFDFLLIAGAIAISVFLLVKQVGETGYAESLDDMSGSIFFVSSVIPAIPYLILYLMGWGVLFFKYRVIDEGDNNNVLSLLIKITVNGLEIVLWSLVTNLIIEEVFTFVFWEKLIYYAALLLFSETVLPIVNTYINRRLYCKFKKSD